MSKDIPQIDKSWTLFLDRDGVINKKLENDYVKTINEFEFLPNVLEAIKGFCTYFHKVIIVTNQQGINKKLMTDEDLEKVHQHLLNEVTSFGGNIDAIYYSPQLASQNSIMRKPNIGMAITAKNDFPTIDFNKSIMVGDSISDMEFAQNTNMFQVFIGDNEDYFSIDSIYSFYKLIKS